MAEALAIDDAGAFAAAASDYATPLRQHIAKEGDVLFPLAESRIGDERARGQRV
jgi:hemerythrin-like domain-containing protein